MRNQLFHILLVEDDDVDAEAALRALRGQTVSHSVTIVPDGFEALKVLRGEEGCIPLPHPYLILLDINLPRMNGLELLTVIRQDVRLKRSIVFVLTTSNRSEDKAAAYDHQVAGYLLKSNAGPDFQNLKQLLDSYQNVVEFPSEGLL